VRRDSLPATANSDTADFEATHRFPLGAQQQINWGFHYRYLLNEARGRIGHNYDPVEQELNPDGMTGRDLARKVQEDNPQLPVIYMSGYSAEIAGKEVSFIGRRRQFPGQTLRLAPIRPNRPCQPGQLIAGRRKLQAPTPKTPKSPKAHAPSHAVTGFVTEANPLAAGLPRAAEIP
jgi:CheY-like chemotaxis protein